MKRVFDEKVKDYQKRKIDQSVHKAKGMLLENVLMRLGVH